MTRRFRWLLGGIVIAAAAIRIFRLNHFSYGLDEILQAYWMRYPWNDLWRELRMDAVHPPLDYAVDRLFESLHPSEAWTKLPAVLWGVGTVAALGMLIARRIGAAAGLVAACLLALAPFHVRYSQEFRPYSVGVFFVVASLLALDRFLERPSWIRLAALFLACLATVYGLYVAAVVLALAGAAMIVEDCFAEDRLRRRNARRFLVASPAFLLALWLAYLPWWPVLMDAMHRPPPVRAEPLTPHRIDKTLSFFAFASLEGDPLGWKGALYWALAVTGLIASARRPRARFLAVWAIAAFAALEVLGQLHPHWYATRRFLPAGVIVPALAALPLASLLRRPVTRIPAAVLLTGVLILEARGLERYFREGRCDWRTLANFVRTHAAPTERVFTENQYSQLCLAFYLSGPTWLYQVGHGQRPAWDLPNLEGEIVRLNWSWKPGTRAWLVLAGEPRHPELRGWAQQFPAFAFPRAEGAILHRLDPELRAAWLAPR
jgi:hypothetical protein